MSVFALHKQGMFLVATLTEAQTLATALQATLAFVTVRTLVEPAPNGFKYAVYWRDAYTLPAEEEKEEVE